MARLGGRALTPHDDVPADIVAALRTACLALPEAYEEPAWVGTRWRVGKQTFAHVVMIESGWPPAYARAAGSDGPIVVVTFRSSGAELEALSSVGQPFFRPPWAPNVVGMVLGPDVDWGEVTELVTESYCVLAPQRLVPRVERPAD